MASVVHDGIEQRCAGVAYCNLSVYASGVEFRNSIVAKVLVHWLLSRGLPIVHVGGLWGVECIMVIGATIACNVCVCVRAD